MSRKIAGHYRMLSNAGNAKFDIERVSARGAARAAGAIVRALSRALPQACTLCAAPSGNSMLCEPCLARMPVTEPACPRCALPLTGADAACGACLAHPPPYTATIAAWRYAFPADRLLHALKYGGHLALAEPFAIALAAAVRRRALPLPDRLFALPLAPRRQRERGFNQAHEIARRMSPLLGIPLASGLRRTRDGPPQAGLTLHERARTVKNAFAFSTSLSGCSIAIVDDVMTTGATLAAATLAAQRAGAARVEAWVVARTPPPAQHRR